MTIKFEKHIQVENSIIALDCLSQHIDLSKQQLKIVMQNGAVWLENHHGIKRLRRAKKSLSQGDKLHVYYDADIQASKPAEAKLISDEGDYSIWNKPNGMYSQGTKWGDHCTIYRYAEHNLKPQRQAFIVHRLDKAANGIIILAHKKTVAAKFSKMFEERRINKIYKAEVEGCIENISLPYEIRNELDGKVAISEIISLECDSKKQRTVVKINIKTGRKHQIRRHLSGMGYPIVGDRLYGAKNIKEDLQLSSIELKFECPINATPKIYHLD